jgi:two-component system alkaline phosphatase synthesis response regulator PhoP
MDQKKRVLLIEEQEESISLIKLQAEISGYKLQVERDGLLGYRALAKEKPDLVILDLMLPGQSGLDICRKVKNHPHLKEIPIIIISDKQEELDIILGLELGADDYIPKPFSPGVLFAKIKAVLRRTKSSDEKSQLVRFGEYTIEPDRYLLRRSDRQISVTLSEFGILKRLVSHRGKVLSRNELLEDVENDEMAIIDRNIDVHVASLRKKLGPNFDWIETVRGVGYRFRD